MDFESRAAHLRLREASHARTSFSFKVSSSISEHSERALLGLFPRAAGRTDAASWLVDQLVEAESHRAGHPDATGAFHALALTQGALLKEEYDLSTHGHADGWVVGALLVDPLEFTLFNMRYGFELGDRALAAMVTAMKSSFPTAKIVRIHTDGFVILFAPTSERRVEVEMVEPLRRALTAAVDAVTPVEAQPARRVLYTLGCCELTVRDPPNWQLLGPLVWAECERALTIAKRQPLESVLRRAANLNGRLPEFE